MAMNVPHKENPQPLIQQLVGKEQLKQAVAMGLTIVQVSFDNENDPIFLASRIKLSDESYIDFVKNIGMIADKNYRIVGWGKESI